MLARIKNLFSSKRIPLAHKEIEENLVDGWDESSYLESNPDVLQAVQHGGFSSGWAHYITFGYREDRPNVSAEVQQKVLDIFADQFIAPVPPAHLRKRVHGDESLSAFEDVGKLVAYTMQTTIAPFIEFNADHRILDFGCGCGRILRYSHKLTSESQLYGSDVDQEAISWCQQNLDEIAEFSVNGELPPIPFDSEFFDFVYAISVFTHLPEDMQFSWLEALKRITKPGGYLLLTVHGEHLLNFDSDANRRRFQKVGFHFAIGDGTEGLPEYYQTSFHTPEYIHKNWGKHFEIVKIIPRGMASLQDIVICRKPSHESL